MKRPSSVVTAVEPPPKRVPGNFVQTRIQDCAKVFSIERVQVLADNLDAAIREDDATLIVKALEAFKNIHVSFEILAETGIGRVVNKLRSGDATYAGIATQLYTRWKEVAGEAARKLARDEKRRNEEGEEVGVSQLSAASLQDRRGKLGEIAKSRQRKPTKKGNPLPPAFNAATSALAARSLDGGLLLDGDDDGNLFEEEVAAWEVAALAGVGRHGKRKRDEIDVSSPGNEDTDARPSKRARLAAAEEVEIEVDDDDGSGDAAGGGAVGGRVPVKSAFPAPPMPATSLPRASAPSSNNPSNGNDKGASPVIDRGAGSSAPPSVPSVPMAVQASMQRGRLPLVPLPLTGIKAGFPPLMLGSSSSSSSSAGRPGSRT